MITKHGTFTVPRAGRNGATVPPFIIEVDPRDHYVLYVITLDGARLRKQITHPSVTDCEQGVTDARHNVAPRGFAP